MSELGPFGAIPEQGGVHFRIWAPKVARLELVLEPGGRRSPERRTDGTWEHFEPGAGAGLRYGYLADGQGPFPDPCARAQPDGVHSLSEVVDFGAFEWSDSDWQAPAFADTVIYELHAGTFTSEGTFDSAAEELARLKELGINAVELMPVASFPGRWNWGYDGVALFAPFEGYGGPAGLQRFVDRAHREGLAVILDVVYNHFGPDGDYTGVYSNQYKQSDAQTPWGAAINFDHPGSEFVRATFIQNALQWLGDYHIDGLRLDATHAIVDSSTPHFLAELSSTVRSAMPGRNVYLTAETHENDPRYVTSVTAGGFGFDAVWADDFHHAARTSIQPDHEGYYASYQGLQSLVRTTERGWLFEGQDDPGYGEPRGHSSDSLPSWTSLVYCLQNHDQVGNRAFGERLTATADEGELRALTTLFLLLPATPLLFQGQEWFSKRPFAFFTDHSGDLADAVRNGRRQEFAKFSAFGDEALRGHIPDPQDERTFRLSKLETDDERDTRAALLEEFHKELLRLRREDPVLAAFRHARLPLRATLEGRTLTVRFQAPSGRRLLVLNLERGAACVAMPEGRARVALESDAGRFGGFERRARFEAGQLTVPGQSAVFVELP